MLQLISNKNPNIMVHWPSGPELLLHIHMHSKGVDGQAPLTATHTLLLHSWMCC